MAEKVGAFAERARNVSRYERKIRLAREKCAHLIAVLLGKHRAGDVGDAAARLDERCRAIEHVGLLLKSLLQRPGTHPPLGVGIAAPRADTGAGRVDEHEIGAVFEIDQQIFPPTRRSDLHVVNPRALEALVDRGKPSLVRIRCVELSAIFHHGGKRERLTAGAGAQIDHLLAGFGAGEQCGKLRTLVLHLHRALDEGRLGMDRGTLGVGVKRDAQADRRPARGDGIKVGQRVGCCLRFGFEPIDPQIERGAARQRHTFGDALVTEYAGEMGIEPLRIVARDPGRSAREIGGPEPRPLLRAQRRRRKAPTVGTRGDRIAIELALEPQHAEHGRARTLVTHDMGARGTPA